MNKFAYMSHYWNNPALREAHHIKLAQYCLMMAADKPDSVQYKNMTVDIDAGEFVLGREKLRDDMNENTPKPHPDDSTWWRRLKKLEAENVIGIRSTKKYSIIKIVTIAEIEAQQEQKSAHQEAAAGREHQAAKEPELPPKEEPQEEKPKKPKKEKIAKTYGEDDIAYKMASFIRDENVKVHKDAYDGILKRGEAEIQKWAHEIDTKLLNISSHNKKGLPDDDDVRLQLVRDVLEFTYRDGFWKDKVLTGIAFCTKFSTHLRIDMGKDKRQQQKEAERAQRRAEQRWPQSKQDQSKDFLARKREEAARKELEAKQQTLTLGGTSNDGNGIH